MLLDGFLLGLDLVIDKLLLLLCRPALSLPLLHLLNLLLHSRILLLNLLELLLLLHSGLLVPIQLISKRGNLLLPDAQILIQSLKFELLIIAIGRFLDRVTLLIVLLLQLLDRLLEASLEVELRLVLGLPAYRHPVLILGALGAQHSQLLLQLADHLLVRLDLLLAILDLFLPDTKHVLRVELGGVCRRGVVGRRFCGYFGGLAIEGPLNHGVQVLDPVSQLEVDLL